jgi:hypothetical protein
MVFFLSCISVVLILVGGAAALYGADTIRSETGATIAIAGVSIACAGFLLLGLVQVSVEIRRLRRAVEEQDDLEVPARAAVPALPPVPTLAAATAAAAADAKEATLGKPDGDTREDSDKTITPEPYARKDEEHAPGRGSSVEAALDTDLLEAEEGHAPAAAPEPPAPVAPPKERGEPVATYTSGANTYFMYGDGTIEAETPKGRYRFETMAELRHYAETGEGGLLLNASDMPGDGLGKPTSREGTITI